MVNSRRLTALLTATLLAISGVLLIAPAAPAGADPGSGSITGTVTAESTGLPLQDIRVSVTTAGLGTSAQTDATGAYTVTGLPNGAYTVQFTSLYDNAVASEYYVDAYTAADATPVQVESNTVSVDASLGDAGFIGGTVLDDVTGDPLEGVQVAVNSDFSGPAGQAATDATGTFLIGGLAPGSYAGMSYYTDETNNYLTLDGTEAIEVVAGSITDADASLTLGASVSGTVTDELTGLPIAGVQAVVGYQVSTTDTSGQFTVTKIPAGGDTLWFATQYAPPYVREYWDNSPTPPTSPPLTFARGATLTGKDAALASFGSISGVVTDGESGSPLEGVTVTADGPSSANSTTTGSDGMYTITGLAPRPHRVRFDARSLDPDYLIERFDDVTYPAQADPFVVPVVSGGSTPSIDAGLELGGSITGTVTAEDTGLPLEGIWVALGDGFPDGRPSATTAADGTYTLHGIHVGTETVRFRPTTEPIATQYSPEYYNDATTPASADPVTIDRGAIVVADVALAPTGSISGVITDEDTGLPMSGIQVEASSPSDNGDALTGADGTYQVIGLDAGDYHVGFSVESESEPGIFNSVEYYNDVSDFASSQLVAVEAGAETSGIDAEIDLTPEPLTGTVSGTITDSATGLPLEGVGVSLVGVNDPFPYDVVGIHYASTTTGPDGTYTFTDVEPRDYRIRANPDWTDPHASGWYGDTHDPLSATPITVTANTTASDIDLALELRPAIAGRVTDGAGNPIEGVYVSVSVQGTADSSGNSATTTDANGEYTVQVDDAGPVLVEFDYYPEGATTPTVKFYDDVLWDWSSDPLDSATLVPVGYGDHATGIDMVFGDPAPATGLMKGFVKGPTGAKLDGARVTLIAEDGTTHTVITHDRGKWAKAVPPGNYKVQATFPGYRPTFNGDAATQALAPWVTVTAGARSRVLLTFHGAPALTGTITDADSGTPLQGIQVNVFDPATGVRVGTKKTNGNGDYAINDLPVGDYKIQVIGDATHKNQWLGGGGNTRDTAAVITLGAANILDAALQLKV